CPCLAHGEIRRVYARSNSGAPIRRRARHHQQNVPQGLSEALLWKGRIMGKPSPPAAPDPNVTIPAQTTSNINTATASSDLNHINQVSPYGSITYDQTGSQN